MSDVLDETFTQLDPNDFATAAYMAARRSGFDVVERKIVYDNRCLSASLQLRKGSVEREVQSDSLPWLGCVLAHFQTNHGLFLPGDEGYPLDKQAVPTLSRGEVSITFKAGTTVLGTDEIRYLEIREGPDLKRVYRLWAAAERVASLVPVLSTAYVDLGLSVDGCAKISSLRGHIDSVRPFEYQEQTAVELAGTDILTGSKVLVKATYNFRVDPRSSIIGFAKWAEPEVFAGRPISPPDLAELEPFAQHGVSSLDFDAFVDALRRIEERDTRGALAGLSRYFAGNLSANDPLLRSAALSFQRAAAILASGTQVYVAIGSVKGINAAGIERVGPGIVIASPKSLPFHLLGREPAEELCEWWTPGTARLVAYFAADDVASTPEKGWSALKSAFDYVNFAISDAGWCHLEADGSMKAFDLNVHQQDAVVELERWYHVHHLINGSAHQYQSGIEKISNELFLDEAASRGMRPRVDVLVRRIQAISGRYVNLEAHLLRAVEWLSRARVSSSPGERFMCLWIALEYLVLRRGEGAQVETIAAAMESRVPPLMSRGERNQQNFWQRIMKDSYAMRCRLVHEAAEERKEVDRLMPYLSQAIVEVVWYASAQGEKETQDRVPADILEEYGQRRRPRSPQSSGA